MCLFYLENKRLVQLLLIHFFVLGCFFISGCQGDPATSSADFEELFQEWKQQIGSDPVAFEQTSKVLVDDFEKNFVFKLHTSEMVSAFVKTDPVFLQALTFQNPNLKSVYAPLWYWLMFDAGLLPFDAVRDSYIKLLRKGLNYKDKAERYALLCLKKTSLDPPAGNEGLLEQVITNLESYAHLEKDIDGSFEKSYEKAYVRYLLVQAYLLKAETTNIQAAKIAALQEAIRYFPSSNDQKFDYVVKTDRQLFESGESAESIVLRQLSLHTKPTEYLDILAKLAVARPSRDNLQRLRSYFDTLDINIDFKTYWYQTIETNAEPAAPSFSLTTLEGQSLNAENYRGQWLLLDFWGTWCVPCIEEFPALNSLDTWIKSTKNKELRILTIACKDTPGKVRRFMKKQNYGFSVAMEDKNIAKSYRVNAFPSKYLITPQGNLLSIPYAADWFEYIENYTMIERIGNSE